MKILAHICCAPDAVYFLKRLREDYPSAEIVGFFYDPNIHPYEEYELRLVETKRVCKSLNIELYEGEYDVENWLSAVKGLEYEPEKGERCKVCFDFRLKKSAEFAKQIGATHLTSTLLMSPKKDLSLVSNSGNASSNPLGIEFLALDYRKGGGSQEMVKLSKSMQLYHQDYCGCVFGLFNQKGEESANYLYSQKERLPGSREELLFIKQARLIAEELNLSCEELEFGFLSWKVLKSSLEVNKTPIEHVVKPYSPSIKGVLKTSPKIVRENLIIYDKGGLVVLLVDDFSENQVNFQMCQPVFMVHKSYKELILSGKIQATLETKIEPSKSLYLNIGNINAKERIILPADSNQNQEINLETIRDLLKAKEMDIKLGNLLIIIEGASSLLSPGRGFYSLYYGIEIAR
ncbi:MAG: epoxyqueuosine reductase QueH [Aquificaceae bacterium]|nr:epoxyqueuosine reductase QueH [Aquificaceae bacterium]MDW8236999.1 epoxyqueuosine reductase QueH [Aquificaceae bacterium]